MISRSLFIIFASIINFCVLKESLIFNSTLSDEINQNHHSATIENLKESLQKYLLTGTEEEFWNHIEDIFSVLERNAQNIQMKGDSVDMNKAVGRNVNKELKELNLSSDLIATGFRAFMNKKALNSFKSNNALSKRFLDEDPSPVWTVVNNCTYVNSTYNDCSITYVTGCEFLLQCEKPGTSTFFVIILD